MKNTTNVVLHRPARSVFLNQKKMKKALVIIVACIVMVASRKADAQYSNRVNMVLLAGYSLPLARMSDYYDGGFQSNLKTVYSISKRSSDIRIGIVANTGYYRFGGKIWYDLYSGNTYKSTSFGVIPLHAGLRFDFGHTKSMPYGVYCSQDFGLTYVDGPTGGSRYGHTFEIGGLISRFDMAMAFHTWKGSTGNNFRYFTFSLGIVLF